MQNLRRQLENDYNNFNYCTGYAYDAAICDIEATNNRIMAYIKGAKKYEQRNRLPELHKDRRNNKELLRNTAKRMFSVFRVQGG